MVPEKGVSVHAEIKALVILSCLRAVGNDLAHNAVFNQQVIGQSGRIDPRIRINPARKHESVEQMRDQPGAGIHRRAGLVYGCPGMRQTADNSLLR